MNPYTILGGALALVIVFGFGAWVGWDYRDGKVAQEKLTAVNDAIKEHNDDVAIDIDAAITAGVIDAKARTRTVTITNEVERLIHDKPAPPDCRVADTVFDKLRLAIQVANGDPDTPRSVPSTGTGLKPPR